MLNTLSKYESKLLILGAAYYEQVCVCVCAYGDKGTVIPRYPQALHTGKNSLWVSPYL